MKTIHKYRLRVTASQILKIPRKWKPLSVAFQNGDLYLWCYVDTESPEEEKEIVIYGTGHEMSDFHKLIFLDTVQEDTSFFVWHVFYKAVP